MDKIKKGDFSQVMDLGKQFLGEETVNDLLHAAADTIVQMKEKDKTEMMPQRTKLWMSSSVNFQIKKLF